MRLPVEVTTQFCNVTIKIEWIISKENKEMHK